MIDSARRARRARIEPLLESARAIADPASPFGRRARERLISSTGLSAQGVNFALERCLECRPSEAELTALIDSTAPSAQAHVLLSANVFVAAHRALALALASAPTVTVRPSRREPEMAELLLEGAPESFQLKPELSPAAGDQLWAYGSDDTLRALAERLPPGVVLHAHGSGFGIAVLDRQPSDTELAGLLPKLAEEVALFDQRGCLSPRVLLLTGSPEFAREVAQALAVELSALETRIPRGHLDPEEAAEITAYRDTASYAGEIFSAGLGFVSAGTSSVFLLPPVGRNLHVLPTSDLLGSISGFSSLVTTCAVAGSAELADTLRRTLIGVRCCDFGHMQTPPFDGPVDRRARRF